MSNIARDITQDRLTGKAKDKKRRIENIIDFLRDLLSPYSFLF
jgi:hypothetical protein